jgi:membrane protease YdiL (CAAX protease family)
MKYKYVLEEVNPKKKTIKWIIMVTTEGLILVFYIFFGAFLVTSFGLVPMVLIVSITSLFILAGLVFAVNRMFPKELGKRLMLSIRQTMRDKPLVGTLIVLLVYFAFLYLPSFPAILLIPLYSMLPLEASIILEFLYSFGFMMLLWLLVVPKSLRLPNGKEKFSSYLRSVKLIAPGIRSSKFLIKILLAITCTGIYFFSFWLFGSILGEFTLNLPAIFGPPGFSSGSFSFGYLIFVIMLIPGIWEEWGFRGVILSLNSRKYSNIWALIISSVTFGLLHFTNILSGQHWITTIFQVLYAAEIGFLFGYIFLKTNSLLPSIIIHYLFNSFGQLFFYSTIFYNEVSAILYLTFAVGLVPTALGIPLIYLVSKFAFPRIYKE